MLKSAIDPPQLSIKLDSSSSDTRERQQLVQEGNDIYLSCQMDANPRPTKAALWRSNGRLISSNQFAGLASQGSASIVINNQSLVLRKISRQQSGQYTCESSNQHGSNSSQAIELVVRHAPACLTDDM